MRLRYVKGSEINVNFGNEKAGVIEHAVHFSPEGEVPEQFVDRLLKNHPDEFVKVEAQPDAVKSEPKAEVVCGVCQKPFKSPQGLLIHKRRMHKEQ